jgi:hypothetical protein
MNAVVSVLPFTTNEIVKVPSAKVVTSTNAMLLFPFVSVTFCVFTTTPASFVIDTVAVVAFFEEYLATIADLPVVPILIPSKFEALAVAMIKVLRMIVNKAFIIVSFLGFKVSF